MSSFVNNTRVYYIWAIIEFCGQEPWLRSKQSISLSLRNFEITDYLTILVLEYNVSLLKLCRRATLLMENIQAMMINCMSDLRAFLYLILEVEL